MHPCSLQLQPAAMHPSAPHWTAQLTPPEHQLRRVPQPQQGTNHSQQVLATAGGGSEPAQQVKDPHLNLQHILTLGVVGDTAVGRGAPVTLPPG